MKEELFTFVVHGVPCEIGYAENTKVYYINYPITGIVEFFNENIQKISTTITNGKATDRSFNLFYYDGKLWKRVIYNKGKLSLGETVNINEV